ncbi:MAG: mandelate racemase/muconate lactonizing enzyme family protein, partial [Hyphomicrobiales bacterium]|nr:mandelate racemase/muconate lactonizing enzyme family protein [Hyphomicrobiales bacterium]
MTAPIAIGRIECVRLRAEVEGLPTSSLGSMAARNGLLVRVEDSDGAFGWGEVWCNFPPHASQSRQQLMETVIAPELKGARFDSPDAIRPHLEKRWSIMATHVGEPGPFSHCIAGLDMALWDLQARRAGQSLAAHLAGQPVDQVKVYASSPDPARAPELTRACLAAGHRAVKLKVGIDRDRDETLVSSVRAAIGDGPQILIDANQRWSVDQATDAINRLAPYGLTFAEEPIAAGAPKDDWRRLRDSVSVPLAAGENICADTDYAAHFEAGALTYYQPDVAKWGGIGGCYSVGQAVVGSG